MNEVPSPVVAPWSTPQVDTSKLADAIEKYAQWWGGIHGDISCPQDDTCECDEKWINDGITGAVNYLRQVAPGIGETPHPPAETTTDEKDTRCVATSGTFRCDREAGHAGHHRLYNETIDEPMFWGQSLLDRIQDYLGQGGFFNPECIDHVMVRALLLDVRDVLVGETQLAVPHASHPPATDTEEERKIRLLADRLEQRWRDGGMSGSHVGDLKRGADQLRVLLSACNQSVAALTQLREGLQPSLVSLKNIARMLSATVPSYAKDLELIAGHIRALLKEQS